MNKINKLILIMILTLFALELRANNPVFNSKIDTNNVLIGNQINLFFEFQANKKVNVNFPNLPDSIGKLEIIEKSKIDTLSQDGLFKLTQKFVITSFDSGSYLLTSQTLTFFDEKNDSFQLQSNQFVLNFTTVEVDTSQGYKDIKPVMDIPIDWREYIIYIVIAFLVIIIGIFIAYYLRKLKRKAKVEDLGYDPKIPPYIMAFESLKQLDSEKLWQKGFVKEYYIRLTDILRLYIQRQLKIDAPEMITDEIIISLEKHGLDSVMLSKMKVLFQNADLAKFAKTEPMPDINTLNLKSAFEFLAITNTEVSNNNQEMKSE